MPTFEITHGPEKGRVIWVPDENAVIGREASAGIRLRDSRSSRQHAEIRKDGADRYSLNDLGSANRTMLNGHHITGWESLKDKAQVVIGNTTLVFHLRGTLPNAPTKKLDLTTDSTEPETIIQRMETQDLSFYLDAVREDSPSEQIGALRFLLNLARAAEEADKPAELAAVLEQGLTEALGADRVLLFVGRDENMRPIERKLPAHLKKIYRLPYSSTVIKRAVKEKASVLSCLNEDERFKDAMSVASGEITSAICVPLLAGGDILGAIYLDRMGEAQLFTANDLDLATAAGLQCSMALLNIRRLAELRAHRDRLEAELTGPDGFIGSSRALNPVYDFIKRVSPTDAGVLILGESGTGKELVARAIHKTSPRSDRPFVIVNCAALAESLAEAELFGHERGAFTGADKARPGRFLAADGGTIFLDEIGELSESIQAKLLRVLEEGEIAPVGEAGVRHIDVRVVAATNRNLATEVEAGRFRRDLYYRLNIMTIDLPPLRERSSDIRLLIDYFIQFFGARCGRPNLTMEADALDICMQHPWPGNVRELKNAIERMVILAQGETLTLLDLPAEVSGTQVIRIDGAAPGGLRPLAIVEKEHILAVIEQVSGNKKRASEILQIDRSTLYAKLKSYGIGLK